MRSHPQLGCKRLARARARLELLDELIDGITKGTHVGMGETIVEKAKRIYNELSPNDAEEKA